MSPTTAPSNPLKFDYAGARKAGFTDQQIAASLATKRAQGINVYVDRAEVQATRAGTPAAAVAPPGATPAAPPPVDTAAVEREHYESLSPFQKGLLRLVGGVAGAAPSLSAEPEPLRVPPAETFGEKAAETAGGFLGFTGIAAPVTLATGGVGLGPLAAGAVGAGVAAAAPAGTLKQRAVRGATMAGASAGLGFLGGKVTSAVAQRILLKQPALNEALGKEFDASVATLVAKGIPQAKAEDAAAQALEHRIIQAAGSAAQKLTTRGVHTVGGAAAFGAAQPAAEHAILGEKGPEPQDMVQSGLELLAMNILLEGRGIARDVRPAPVAKPLGFEATQSARAAAEARQFQPTKAERDAAVVNVSPPKGVQAAPEETAQLGRALQARQLSGPIHIVLPDGLKISNGEVIPSLARVFPGDPKPIRITVFDHDTGQLHSVQYGGVTELRDALRPIRGPIRELPGTAAPRASLPEPSSIPPAKMEIPRPTLSEGQITRTAPRPGLLPQAAPGAAEARAKKQARLESAPAAIAALEQQIRDNPGDKRVGRWKRRVENLKALAPKAEPVKEEPKAAAAAGTGAVKGGEAAPPLSGEMESAARLYEAAGDPGRSDRSDEMVLSAVMRRFTPEQRKAVRARAAQISDERATRRASPPASIERAKPPRAATSEPGAPALGGQPLAAATARKLAPERQPETRRGVVPGMQFKTEADARSTATAMLRADPTLQPKIVYSPKRGYEIEVNQEGPKELAPVTLEKAPGRAEQPAISPQPSGRAATQRIPQGREAVAPAPTSAREEPVAATGKAGRVESPAPARSSAPTAGAIPGTWTGLLSAYEKGSLPPELMAQIKESIDFHTQHYTAASAADNKAAAIKEVLAKLAARPKPAPQAELGGEVSENFALTGQKAKPMEGPSGRSFVEEFEDLARQGRPLEEAANLARERSGAEPPAGLDLEARWSRVRREAKEAAGQEDIFGGAAMLGRPSGERTEADLDQVERKAPPAVTETQAQATKPSEAKTVPTEGLWFWKGFQQRNVGGDEKPTQNPRDLVDPEHVGQLLESRGGFDRDQIRRRPVIVWRDAKGELGQAGRMYVIDGHHRMYMAREAGEKNVPAVEVFGDLAYAKQEARTVNAEGKPNTFVEQARIARELKEEGADWPTVAAKLKVKESRAKALVDFAHLDPGVRSTYFPPGNETALFNGTAQGEVVGKLARMSPDLMTSAAQDTWLRKAIDEDWTASQFSEQVRGWHALMSAFKQEALDIGGARATKLAMTPNQFAATSGRIRSALDAAVKQTQNAARQLENIGEMARGKGHDEALRQIRSMLADVEKRGHELVKARKEIDKAILDALNSAARGEKDFLTSLDAIQKRVDEILGSEAPKPKGPLARRGDLFRAVARERRRLAGKARRDPVVKKATKPPLEPPPAVQRIIDALKAAKPVRAEQEALDTAERIRKIKLAREAERGKTGLARHIARSRALKGTHPIAQFESIAKALSQDNVDELINMIFHHPALEFFEQKQAIDGLQKLLGERGGRVPAPKELELLELVFGPEFVKAMQKIRPQITGLKELGYAIANTSRTLRTSFDLSAPLRQGIFLAPSFPKEWGRAFVDMHRYFASEKNFSEGMNEIYNDPMFKIARRALLEITRPGSHNLLAQEEAYLGSNFAEKIPVVGAGVKASERGYVGFLNKLRFDVFKSLMETAQANNYGLDKAEWADKGKRVAARKKAARDIARFVNAGTGRGESKFISNHAQGLNALFFAPRLMQSRLHFLNPKNYVTGSPMMRHQYIKSMAAFSGAASLALTLASMAGAQVEGWRGNADWGKIRVGGVVYDILGGFAQYLRFFPTVAKALYDQARGEDTEHGTAKEITQRFLETKLSPVAGFINGALNSKQMFGGDSAEDFQVGPELAKLFLPMIGEDFFDVMKQDPRQLPFSVPASTYGTSTQVYPEPED